MDGLLGGEREVCQLQQDLARCRVHVPESLLADLERFEEGFLASSCISIAIKQLIPECVIYRY
jgi:hypothetical protein